MKSPNELSASEAAAAIAAGRLKSVELVEACLARIEAREPTVQAWEQLDARRALDEARALDREAPRGPLHGVPVGVKDIIDTADFPTAYGSPIYAGYRPGADASCVGLVRRAGGIILGKTVTTEFAAFYPGKTRNPINPEHTPGGSSSGSAAAVADFQVPVAFGTQTAGSLTRPAAYCGVVAFKPSFGTYSLEGVKAEAQSFDTLGTIGRTVDDALLMWRVLQAGDAPTPPVPARPRIGLCRTPFWPSAAPEARDAFKLAGQKLAAAGFDLDEVELPGWFDTLLDTHVLVLEYEATRTWAYEGEPPRRDKLSPGLRDMVDRGWTRTPESYLAARRAMARARQELAPIIQRYDALMAPAAPGEAPRGLGSTGDPVFNRIWTLLHVPAVNLTVSRGPHGLPVGVQFVGAYDNDLALLALGNKLAEALA
jgi:amidase